MDTNYNSLKQKLLERFVSDELTKEQYDEKLAAIEQMEIGSQTAVAPFTSNNSNPMLHSMGDMQTGRQVGPQLEVGQSLGKFELVKPLGRGGMGEVWKARDTVGERDVVIKVLPPELSGNQGEIARVKQSFQKVHALHHEHICPTHDLGHDPAIGYYLVMQFISGVTLNSFRQQRIEQNDFSFELIQSILMRIATALDYAHSQKVIHRDIKPDNVMISDDAQQLWLIDFGLAAEIQSSMVRVSQQQMDRSGTYPYMAPEQWKGTLQDGATDQYALAVLAYEMLSGHLPFDVPDSYMLRQCVLNEMPEPLEDQAEAVNSALAKAFSKDRKQRFASCVAFVEALQAVPKQTQNDVDPYDEMSNEDLLSFANSGNANAQTELGVRYDRGLKGLPRDLEQAKAWYEKAAEKGVLYAQFRLGKLLYNEAVKEKDYQLAFYWFRKAAENGYVDAEIELGMCYRYGKGVEINDRLADHWLTKSALAGDAYAQSKLAQCYDNGEGFEQDTTKAMQWYAKAAEQGDPWGQWTLGDSYEYGKGVTQDKEKAFYWYQKAADQGDSPSQHSLAMSYLYGGIVEKDIKQAIYWLEKAAAQGHRDAQYSLAEQYRLGNGVPEDDLLAVKWYTKAAEQGQDAAQGTLGDYYREGWGVEQDDSKAKYWYQQAAKNSESARKKLAEYYGNTRDDDLVVAEVIEESPKLDLLAFHPEPGKILPSPLLEDVAKTLYKKPEEVTEEDLSKISYRLTVRHSESVKQLAYLNNKVSISNLYIDSAVETFQSEHEVSWVKSLTFWETKFSDIQGIHFFSKLEEVTFHECPHLANIESLTDIKDLKSLVIRDCPAIRDISFIQQMIELKDLGFKRELLSDSSVLLKLTKLEKLHIDYTRYFSQDIEVIKQLPKLNALILTDCSKMRDIQFLSELTQLETFSMSNATILTDIEPLFRLSFLNYLYIGEAYELEDISPLRSLVQLETLYLTDCKLLSDIGPLQSIKNLKSLNIQGCPISDLASLTYLRQLKDVWIRSDNLSLEQCNKLTRHLEMVSGKKKDKHTVKGPNHYTFP